MIIGHAGHRNYRSYDEFVTIYDHQNIFRKYGHWCFFACLFKCSLFNIFVYGSWICVYLMNTLVYWLIAVQRHCYVRPRQNLLLFSLN